MGEDRSRWLLDTVEVRPSDAPTRPARGGAPVPAPDRFAEIAELGRGGMGRVFAAHDRQLGRIVAVKQALANDTSTLARFDREVLIAARLQHPNLLPVLDAGRDDLGRPYYVMNKVDGQTLEVLVHAAPALPARLALVPRVAAVVDAVAYAHARGIVHRDIKPANILVGQFGEALLIDWGIARILEDAPEAAHGSAGPPALTRAGTSIGTPGFMPPEQARGQAADATADVYALGGTLYFVLAGRRPFDDVPPTEAVARAAGDHAPSFDVFDDAVPRDLVAVVRRAMAVEPAARYPDAGALAGDLRAFLAGRLVTAHRYSAAQLVARFVRRHRLAVAIAAIALAVIAIGAAISLRNIITARGAAVAARHAAEARQLELLENLARSDPDHALATIAHLPDDSPLWARTRGAVTTAVHAGAGRGFALGASTPLRVRPDGAELAVIHGTGIRYFDPALTTSEARPLATALADIAWIDATALLAATRDHALVLVARGGAGPRTIDRGTVLTLPDAGLAIVDGRLLEVDARGAARELARDVVDARRLGATTLWHTREALFARDGGGAVTLLARATIGALEVRGDGREAAYLTREQGLSVWSPGAGAPREVGRWTHVSQVTYVGTELWVLGDDRWIAVTAGGLQPRAVPPLPLGTAWHPDGAYGFRQDTISWATRGGTTPLVTGRAMIRALAVAGDHLIAVDQGGVLRTWRRDQLRAVVRPPAPFLDDMIGLGARHVVVRGATDVRREDVRTWRLALDGRGATELALPPHDGPWRPALRCEHAGGWLFLAGNAWEAPAPLFRVGDGAPRPLGIDAKGILACTDATAVVLTAREALVLDRADPVRVHARIPATGVIGAAFHGEHLLLHHADGRLARHDRTGRLEATHAAGPIGPFAMATDGTVLYERAGRLFAWQRGEPRQIAVGAAGLAISSIAAGRDTFLVRGNTTRYATTIDLALLVDARGVVRRMANADATPQLVGDRVLTTNATGTATVLDLRDGTTAQLAMPDADQIWMTEGGIVIGLSRRWGVLQLVALDEVPRTPAALRTYVRGITNAVVEPGATFASFPRPSDPPPVH